jgi:hypothetical protein
MVKAPTAEELYASAAKFAQYALDAHHKGDHQRVAMDAGTSLEHLTKACLAKRSPALLGCGAFPCTAFRCDCAFGPSPARRGWPRPEVQLTREGS